MKILTFLILLISIFLFLPGSAVKAQWCSISVGGVSLPNPGHVNTALGCLNVLDTKLFVTQITGWGLGIAGMIAFIIIAYSGFMIATASGDPKRIKAAQELLVAAISGLVLIALTIVLLNFIGIKILNLGGLGFNV